MVEKQASKEEEKEGKSYGCISKAAALSFASLATQILREPNQRVDPTCSTGIASCPCRLR
jgi:hypothetical protein